MGQKVNPVGLRVGVIRDWDSRWYADKKDVPKLLHEDIKIREYLEKFYAKASISRIEIERIKGASKDRVRITLHTAKPGMVIGQNAELKNKAVAYIAHLTKKEIVLNVVEIKRPELDANLVAKSIADRLENRASFRRVQKMAIQQAMKAGAKGAKTLVSGRLGGAEMARSEGYSEGQVPLHTFRADVDYALAEALTTYGKMGVKVWIYRGEVLPKKKMVNKVSPNKPSQNRTNAKQVDSTKTSAKQVNKGGK